MRIGVDGGCWSNDRGYGRFTRELLRAMVARSPEDEFVVFADGATADALEDASLALQVVRVSVRVAPSRAASADGYRTPADMIRLTRAVHGARPDVFFSPSVYTYFPLPPRLPALVAVHDVIAERFPELTLPTRRARWFWRTKVRLALAQADLVLTVSEYSAREIGRVLGVPRWRIRVAEPAPAPAFRPGSTAADIAGAASAAGVPPGARWFTYVGGFNPHKRVDRLIRAHAEVARLQPRNAPHLVLVGKTDGDVFHGNLAQIRNAIGEAGTSELVHWAGFVEDAELRHLHAGGLGLVLVSEAEGFGLPAVEAAACGAPVIATTASPLPELLEGGGIFVEPGDEHGLVEALGSLAGDESVRRRLGGHARARANALSWEKAADATLAALRAAAVQGGGTLVATEGRDGERSKATVVR